MFNSSPFLLSTVKHTSFVCLCVRVIRGDRRHGLRRSHLPFSSAVVLHCCPILCQYCLSNDHRSSSSSRIFCGQRIFSGYLSASTETQTACRKGEKKCSPLTFSLSAAEFSFSFVSPFFLSTELIHSFSLFSLFFGLIPSCTVFPFSCP